MQTGEAVIFRSLELSIPCWLVWKWAMKVPAARSVPARFHPAPRAQFESGSLALDVPRYRQHLDTLKGSAHNV
jgi:hypothetical protein